MAPCVEANIVNVETVQSDSAFSFGSGDVSKVRVVFVVGYSIMLLGATRGICFSSLVVPASLTGQACPISWLGRHPPDRRRRLLPQNGIPRPGPEGSCDHQLLSSQNGYQRSAQTCRPCV